MLWLLVIILAYFLFSLASLGDKYLLVGPPNPKSYAFYVGILSILVLLLIPFVEFSIIPLIYLLLCFLAGAIFVLFTFSLFSGFERFEVSTVVPAFGGFLPLFTLGLAFIFFGEGVVLGGWNLLAFLILILGSVLITKSPSNKFSFPSLKIALITALFASLYFILAKHIYLFLGFWTGFIWIRVGSFIAALLFIFSKEVKKEIFKGQFTFTKKTTLVFLFVQGMGAAAFVLQNWAVDLANAVFLPVIGALMGVQYAFLFFFSVLLSWKFPWVWKEKLSKRNIFEKISAIIIIAAGLAILSLK